MKLLLSELPSLKGIYDGKLPARLSYLHPEAAKALLGLEKETGGLTYTSMLRSANQSLVARRTKPKLALPPGYSGHNYGLSVDLDLKTNQAEFKASYSDIIDMMVKHGWYCHRRDGKGGAESWHFNYFGEEADRYLKLSNQWGSTWKLPVEGKMVILYREAWQMTDQQVQGALAKMGFYKELVDGQWGEHSREALYSFRRAYFLSGGTKPNPIDKRTLSFATATKKVVPIDG